MHANENPFSIQKIHSLPFAFEDGMTLDRLASNFRNQWQRNPRMCLWGQHGAGKTTLLRSLQATLEGQGVRALFLSGANHALANNRSSPSLAGSSSSWFGSHAQRKFQLTDGESYDVVLLDSGECLRGIAWWRFLSQLRHKPLLMTSHRPSLPVLYHCQTSKATFVAMCQQLLISSVSGVGDNWAAAQLEAVFEQNSGDVRKCFFALYDQCTHLQ